MEVDLSMRFRRSFRRGGLAVCAALALTSFSAMLLVSCSKNDDVTTADSNGEVETKNPVVSLKTTKGTVTIELYPDKAPKSVENFLAYSESGFYDGTLFHRVVNDFIIQAGGYDAELNRKETREPIQNEANNGLKNERGTVAMARTSEPNSATSQFFINVKDNAFLDFKSETPQGWGYAVIGRVIEGMDVVDAIAGTETIDRGGAFRNLPSDPVVIESATAKKPS